jgi:hypothetical protein
LYFIKNQIKVTFPLLALIERLTKSEKRYCSVYLQKHFDKDNRFYQYFQDLCKSNTTETYKDIAVLKVQLYDQLLNALFQYNLASDPEIQLFRAVFQCNFLLHKGLMDECEKKIKKTQDLAIKYENFEVLMLLSKVEFGLMSRKYFKQIKSEEIDHWYQKIEKTNHSILEYYQYKFYSGKAYQLQYQSGNRGKELAKKLEPILALPIFQNYEKITTINAKLDYLQIHALYYFSNLNAQEAFNMNSKFLMTLEENQGLLMLYADRYFSVFNNYLIDSLILKKYDLLLPGIEKLRNLHKEKHFEKLTNFESNVFRLSTLLEINYHINTGQYEAVYLQKEMYISSLKTHEKNIVKHNVVTIQYLLSLVCFYLGGYDESSHLLWTILQSQESNMATDLYLSVQMLQIICYFEMSEWGLLESSITAYRKKISQKDEAYDIQKQVSSFMASQINKPKFDFNILNKKLLPLFENPKSNIALNQFAFDVWIKSKTEKRGFKDVWMEEKGVL